MTVRSAHRAHERLLADLTLLNRRAQEFADRLSGWATTTSDEYRHRLQVIQAEVRELLDRVEDWDEVEVGTPTRAKHLGAEIDALEGDFRASTEFYAPDYELAMDQQVRVWKARLDALRLQGALASMELKDELSGLSERLDQARAGVLIELQNAAGDSGDLVVDVRDDLEAVLIDVRNGLERAYDAVFGGRSS